MLFQLFLLFTLVPLIELSILIRIGQVIHFWPTVGLILTTGIIGAALARHEGLRTLHQIQTELGAGKLPANRLVDALLILVAGALLITPGVLTDCVGFLLLVPLVRAKIRESLKKRFQARFVVMSPGKQQASPRDDVIDVEARPADED